MPQTLSCSRENLVSTPTKNIVYSVEVSPLPPEDRLLDWTHRAALFVAHHNGTPERRVSRLGSSPRAALAELNRILSERACSVPSKKDALKAVEALQEEIDAPERLVSAGRKR